MIQPDISSECSSLDGSLVTQGPMNLRRGGGGGGGVRLEKGWGCIYPIYIHCFFAGVFLREKAGKTTDNDFIIVYRGLLYSTVQ